MSVAAELNRIRRLAAKGDVAAARRAIAVLVEANPSHAEAHFLLGQLLHRQGELDAALVALKASETLAPRVPLAALGQSVLLRDLGRFAEAHAALDRALAAAPDLADHHQQRALIFQCEGRLADARLAFEQQLAAGKPSARLLNNYGNTLKQLGDNAAAVAAFGRAIEVEPRYQLAYRNLGDTLYYDGQMQGAEAVYRTMTERFAVSDFEVWRRWGHALNAIGETSLAEHAWQTALKLGDTERMTAHALLFQLKRRNATQAALTLAADIMMRDPRDVAAVVAEALTLPSIYDSQSDVAHWRARYEQGIHQLAARDATEFRADEIANLAWSNFHLAYQGHNDRDLQARLGQTLSRWMQSAAPQFTQPLTRRESGSLIRVGFWSSFLRDCTVGKYFESWVTGLPREEFEVVVFHASFVEDWLVDKIRKSVKRHIRVVGAPSLHAQTILDQHLDVLIYPEVGMDAATTILTNMRLAPVQVAAWGHPVTTGSAQIDHYFSVAAMEPPDYVEHYSETVHLLPGLGTRYVQPTLSGAAAALKRADVGLPDHRALLLVPQSAFKVHPDNDDLFARILHARPEADIVMFVDAAPENTAALGARLARVMHRYGVDWPSRHHLLPRGDHQRYLAVNRLCDLMLDTLHWSGGNTSLDAIAMGLPVVTLPGAYMRGRQSLAMLEIVGELQSVVTTTDEYIQCATTMIGDTQSRDALRGALNVKAPRLFGDESATVALATLLKRLA